MKRCRIFLQALGVALTAVTVLTATTASAQTVQPTLLYRDQHDAVYTAPAAHVDKETFSTTMKSLNPFSPTPNAVYPMYTSTLNGNQRETITPPGGSSGDIVTYFSDTLDYNICCHGTINGNSHTVWLGTSPYNADKVTLQDIFTFVGVNVAVTIGTSGWSISGGLTSTTATWNGSVSNNWRIDHYYTGLAFDGYQVWVSHQATGEFKFGSAFYDIGAYDSTLLSG